MSYFPSVIEPSITGDRAYDVLSRLLKDRIIVVGEIDDETFAKIKSLYPNDKAIGYQENEMRGLMVIKPN